MWAQTDASLSAIPSPRSKSNLDRKCDLWSVSRGIYESCQQNALNHVTNIVYSDYMARLIDTLTYSFKRIYGSEIAITASEPIRIRAVAIKQSFRLRGHLIEHLSK